MMAYPPKITTVIIDYDGEQERYQYVAEGTSRKFEPIDGARPVSALLEHEMRAYFAIIEMMPAQNDDILRREVTIKTRSRFTDEKGEINNPRPSFSIDDIDADGKHHPQRVNLDTLMRLADRKGSKSQSL